MIVIALLLATSAPKWEDALGTGDALLATCADPAITSRAACSAWVDGLVGGVIVSQFVTKRCIANLPEEGTTGAYKDVILSFLKDRPNMRHYLARVSALMALQVRFPCQSDTVD